MRPSHGARRSWREPVAQCSRILSRGKRMPRPGPEGLHSCLRHSEPRTCRRGPLRSRSFRMSRSVRCFRPFFIGSSLVPHRPARADKANSVSSISMNHGEQSTLGREPERDASLLVLRMVRVRNCTRPHIPKHVRASSKVTRCLRRFDSALLSDHVNWMDQTSDDLRLTLGRRTAKDPLGRAGSVRCSMTSRSSDVEALA